MSREQAARNRERVVEVAGQLFAEHGFDAVGIDELMAAAGLTRGGFYKSFPSKDGLIEAACGQAVQRSDATWEALLAKEGDPFHSLVDFYLSAGHRDNRARGCPYAAMASEACRRQGPVKRIFGEGIDTAIGRIAGLLPGRFSVRRRERAIATLAGMVGAVILARAVDDQALSDEILASTRRAVLAGSVPASPQASAGSDR